MVHVNFSVFQVDLITKTRSPCFSRYKKQLPRLVKEHSRNIKERIWELDRKIKSVHSAFEQAAYTQDSDRERNYNTLIMMAEKRSGSAWLRISEKAIIFIENKRNLECFGS